MMILLGGLTLTAILGFAAWTAGHGSSESAVLPCPPATVAVVWSTRDAPQAAREAVAEAIRTSGRKSGKGGWGSGEHRDLVVVWSPGTGTSVSSTSAPVKMTLGAVPSAAEVRAVLGARLAACGTTPTPNATAAPGQPQEPGQDTQQGPPWPWEQGWSATGLLGLVLGAWWLAGPNLVHGLWRAIWPLRLARRRWQRWGYQRGLKHGVLPVEWPERVSAGQRWRESAEAMRDRRTYRQQVAQSEPERRAALRKAIREERLAGTGIGPASLWRAVYRQPAPQGAPEKEEVSE